MQAVAIIQARMGSTRLPGKVMLSLDGGYVIEHDILRAQASAEVEHVVVATTFHPQDDIVAHYAKAAGANVYRGSQDDVLGRIHSAAEQYNADIIVRLTGDNPFVEPELVSEVVRRVRNGVDYASNKIDRTWPVGVDAEAFTMESFDYVESVARAPHHREHVTPYYHEHAEKFDIENITADEVYGEKLLHSVDNIRMTLDEMSDYIVYHRIYNEVDYDNFIDVREAIEYILDNNLQVINKNVDQRTNW